ncbi:MAG TPA: hypothetical protein VF158_14450 [Longimicrobiales bacterium]
MTAGPLAHVVEPELAPEPLTPAEAERLAALEARIASGLTTFVEVGSALAEVRDARLYRERFGTFERYLAERWGLSRRRGYQLIEAAEAVKDFAQPPAVESHAVALAAIAPELREDAYRAVERLGKVTADAVRALARAPEGAVESLAAMMQTEPEFVELAVELVKEVSGGKPSPSVVRSLAAIAHGVMVTGALDVGDGTQKRWLDMKPEERRAFLQAQLDAETYERQMQHKAARAGTEKAQRADPEVDRVTIPKRKYEHLRALAAYAPKAKRDLFRRAWQDDLGEPSEDGAPF